MKRSAALANALALTEQVVAECERGEATSLTLNNLTERRARCFREAVDQSAVTATELELVSRLQQLDALLMRWCTDMQRDLEHNRSLLHARNASPDTAARVLSDVA